jgi:hypothetical protein
MSYTRPHSEIYSNLLGFPNFIDVMDSKDQKSTPHCIIPLLSPPYNLKIVDYNGVVEFRGNTAESCGAVLSGHIELDVGKSIQLKKLRVELVCTVFTRNTGHQPWNTIVGEVISRDRVDIFSSSKSFSNSVNRFPFEFILSGESPTSVSSERLKVEYKLVAYCRGNGRWSAYKLERPVQVVRWILPTSSLLFESLDYAGNWNELIQYSISAPHKVYGRSDTIEVNFQLQVPFPYFQIQSVGGFLKQKINIPENSSLNPNLSTLNALSCIRLPYSARESSTSFQDDSTNFSNFNIHLPLVDPITSEGVLYSSTQNKIFEVTHHIKLNVIYSMHGVTKSLSIKTPITLIEVEKSRLLDGLPRYGDLRESWLVECDSPPPLYNGDGRLSISGSSSSYANSPRTTLDLPTTPVTPILNLGDELYTPTNNEQIPTPEKRKTTDRGSKRLKMLSTLILHPTSQLRSLFG